MLANFATIQPGRSTSRELWRAWAGPLVVTALLLAAVYFGSPNFRAADSPDGSPYAGDFLQEWLGGYIVRAGDYHRFYDVEYAQSLQHDANLVGFRWNDDRYLPIVYPPFYYAAVCPLSFLSVGAAAWVWAAMMAGCLVASAALLVSSVVGRVGPACVASAGPPSGDLTTAIGGPAIAPRSCPTLQVLPWVLPGALLFMPLIENLTSSQKGTVCLLILTGAFLLSGARRPLWAGLVFGLLAFKPQLTLVIAAAMLLAGQWRFVLGGATTGLVLGGVSLALGLDVCRQYVAFSTGAADYLHTSGYDLTKSHCLYGFFTLLCGGQATVLVKAATLVACLGVAVLLAVALRKGVRPGEPRFRLQFSALVVATLLVSPHLFTYDLTILLLPMFLVGQAMAEGTVSRERRAVFGWLLAGLFALAGLSPTIAAQTGVQMTTLLMVGLLVVLARECVNLAPSTSSPAAGEAATASCPSPACQ